MFSKRISILIFVISALALFVIALSSSPFASELRWTHWELPTPQAANDAPPGALVARTEEIGVINSRIRWVKTDWLTTPHVPLERLKEVPAENGLSMSWRDRRALPLQPRDLDWNFAGFGFGRVTFFRYAGPTDPDDEGLWQANATEFCVPMWILLIVPAIPLFRFRRKTRLGYCTQCGYDLRATPERCPECGMTAEKISPIAK